MADNTRKQLPQIILLRGLAALMVAIFHLYCGNPNLFSSGILKNIFSYGYLGVPIFFFISGFIICYSLPQAYQLKQFPTFIQKRLVRVEPPYIFSLIVILALNYAAAHFTHNKVEFAWRDFLLHFIYLNNFGLGVYYNVVYWTLGIEFQFYIIIGLLYPVLYRSQITVIALMIGFLALSFLSVKGMQLVFPYLAIFGMGIITYFYLYRQLISGLVYMLIAVIFLLEIYFYGGGIPTLLSTIFAATMVFYWKGRHLIFDFFSNISFSLYLTHTIIGGKIINMGLRKVSSTAERYALFFVALLASVVFAYAFYIFIERKAVEAGKKIRYKEPLLT